VAFRPLNSVQIIGAASAAGRSESTFMASTRVLTRTLNALPASRVLTNLPQYGAIHITANNAD
jgi:hypothetical protein